MTNHSFWYYWFVFFGVIAARYFLVAGGAYYLFYSVLGKFLSKRSLRLKPPLRLSIRNDIVLSIASAIIFALAGALLISEYYLGITRLYTNLDEYGLWYLVVSFVIVLILQDTYFYFTHRLFHHRWLFKWMHRGHHQSGEPTPWSSFAFDPPEAILQALFFVVLVLIIPLHYITLMALLMTMTIWAVLTHLGFQLLTLPPQSHWLSKWFIGATYHSIHHQKYTVHYGLYFTFWDKLLGTQVDDN